jgi:hypothetical protein
VRPGTPSQVRRWAGAAAVAAVVLFAAGNALWAFEQPQPGASAATLLDFYGTASDRIVIGALLSLVSIAVFAVFAAALRRVLLDHGAGDPLADVAFAGVLLGLAAGLGAETINMAAALRAGDEELTAPLALALFDISYVLGSYAAGIGFGLLMLAVSAAALRSPSLLPRRLAILGLVIGVASITPLAALTIGEYTVGPPFLVVLVLGVRLLRGGATAPAPTGDRLDVHP